MTKYFRLMATDACPFFEPTSQYSGVWSGVAKVSSDAEIERLTKRGSREITEAEYNDEIKKKALLQDGFQDFRPVFSQPPPVRAAAPVAPEPTKAPTPAAPPTPTKALPVEEVAKPAPIPRRRSSVVTPQQ